ncbi:hypothetical protein D3C71_2005760 [compost metagenome]
MEWLKSGLIKHGVIHRAGSWDFQAGELAVYGPDNLIGGYGVQITFRGRGVHFIGVW